MRRIVLAALLICIACDGQPPGAHDEVPSGWVPFEGRDFSLRVPDSVAVSARNPVGDFELYAFSVSLSASSDTTRLLNAYAGFHPSFPEVVPAGASVVSQSISGFPSKSIRWTGAGNSRSREVLVEIPTVTRLSERRPDTLPGVLREPRYVHFWYRDLRPGDARIADRIITTIRADSLIQL